MPKAKANCGRPQDHTGKHMTPEAVAKWYAAQNQYNTQRRHDRLVKINEYKLQRGCIDCGYAENAVALDFDHRDPELKDKRLAIMLTYAWARIVAELDKCDIRCANCHRIKTFNLGQSQYRRKPATETVLGDGLLDEITGPPPRP